MTVKLFANMFLILFLCPVLLVAEVLTLTIDTQLGTSVEDCFERISIGERLPRDAIYRNVSELTTRECEQICKQDKQCQSYDYGVGAKGNATCNLSNVDEKEIKEKSLLKRNSDYDVYIRRVNCEQSPPTPIQGQFDEPEEGPAHRPVFRPGVDEKKPLADEFHDLRPFETVRPDFIKPIPPYRPNRPTDSYRPDDYSYQKPNYNAPPQYGDHKPVDIPLKPTRPSYRPDPYDTLYFRPLEEKPYHPNNHGLYRPDPLYPPQYTEDIPDIYGPKPKPRPPLAPYIPDEKPLYHYIIRPNRKPPSQIPRPDDFGYGHRPQADDFRPDPYGPIGPPSYNRPNNPIDPYRPDDYSNQKPNYNMPPAYGDHKPPKIPYHPTRPYEKPVYHYESQYASHYGQNNDNSIHVEIVDPPRPYKPHKPSRPSYTSQNYFGFESDYNSPPHHGTHYEVSQGDYGQNHNSYGSGDHNQNSSYGHKPQNPYIDDKPQSSYGFQRPENHDTSYGHQKPSYHEPDTPSYSNSYGSNSAGYAHKPQDISNNYGSHNKPLYDDGYSSYGGSHRPTHHEQYGSYGQTSQHGYDSYENNRPSFGHSEENYNYRPSHNRPSYGQDTNHLGGYNNNDKYDVHKPSYGQEVHKYPSTSTTTYEPSNGYGHGQNERPAYHQPTKKPIHSAPSYGETSPDDNQPSYGEKPSYEEKPPYGEKPSYGTTSKPHRPEPANNGYGNQEDDYKGSGYGKPANTSGYNSHDPKPVYEYELDKPHNVPSYIYGPSGDIVTSRPVAIGDYGGSFGRNPSYGLASYKGKCLFFF